MKFITIIALFLGCKTAYTQTIYTLRYPITAAQLTSEEAVQIFMDSLFKEESISFKVMELSKAASRYARDTTLNELADSLGVKGSFYKADFDGNGMLDILVSGNYYNSFMFFAVLFQANQQCQLHWLSNSVYHGKALFRIVKLKRKPALEYYYDPYPFIIEEGEKTVFNKKRLIFYKGGFVEYNPKVKKHKIEKIAYSTSYCFGRCPKFDLTIEADRQAKLYAGTDNMEGGYTALIKKADYDAIVQLLNYTSFENLNNKYSVHWTDDQTCTLTVTYDGGKVKKIEDYGMIGTFGLDRVYQVLFDMRFDQDWVK
jgi:Domain of unknown function (DUF6438)